ncbi:hypothetical protein DES52_1239 [Deinococcus yavapaiensis KR-236]|uniref:Uncharacterized protein n=1 Tax=Deinococcus yavapaiensis KR-236 TaxID=694435 RepID=A0A318S3S4_9DEIO|nr:hypothetical protein DES52_1239 [Deinococcus yavapaiensis KR-236]
MNRAVELDSSSVVRILRSSALLELLNVSWPSGWGYCLSGIVNPTGWFRYVPSTCQTWSCLKGVSLSVSAALEVGLGAHAASRVVRAKGARSMKEAFTGEVSTRGGASAGNGSTPPLRPMLSSPRSERHSLRACRKSSRTFKLLELGRESECPGTPESIVGRNAFRAIGPKDGLQPIFRPDVKYPRKHQVQRRMNRQDRRQRCVQGNDGECHENRAVMPSDYQRYPTSKAFTQFHPFKRWHPDAQSLAM